MKTIHTFLHRCNLSWYLSLLSSVWLALGCSGLVRGQVPPGSDEKTENVAKIKACDMVTVEEAGATQGAKMKSGQSSESSDGTFLTTQCYLGSEEPDKSISIAIIQRDPAQKSPRKVSEYWHDSFARFEKPAEQGKRDSEKGDGKPESQRKTKTSDEKEEVQATKIAGVGDEAFWSGARIGGVFYVLKGEVIVRLSVGGPDTQEEKLAKCKALAQKIMSRFRS